VITATRYHQLSPVSPDEGEVREQESILGHQRLAYKQSEYK